MKFVHDADRCEGHGLCAQAAPQLLHLDDEGWLVIDQVEVEDGSPEARVAARAAMVCPMAALRVV